MIAATALSDQVKPKIFGTKAIKRKILENKMTGIAAMKPSRIALKYAFREIFSKKGFLSQSVRSSYSFLSPRL